MQLSFHWGTFVKATPSRATGTTSVQLCLEIAKAALRRFGLIGFDPAQELGDFAVAGRTPDSEVIAQIVCASVDANNTWIIVSACSNSSNSAGQVCNFIRDFIMKR